MVKSGLLLICFVCACQSHEPSAEIDLESSFASVARSVYSELERTPLGDSVAVELGLFGDLNVMAGEHVVMGRYRYRVDTLDGVPVGHLSFLVRAPAGLQPVPVQMSFERADHSWRLTSAEYVPVGDKRPATARVVGALDQGLQAWTREAAQSAGVQLQSAGVQ